MLKKLWNWWDNITPTQVLGVLLFGIIGLATVAAFAFELAPKDKGRTVHPKSAHKY